MFRMIDDDCKVAGGELLLERVPDASLDPFFHIGSKVLKGIHAEEWHHVPSVRSIGFAVASAECRPKPSQACFLQC